ncbi:MAG: glycosyltransferase family 4 protein [Candidatus Dormibacteraceae bacterium]
MASSLPSGHGSAQIPEINLAVDGSGLARSWAGVGTYTTHLLRAMSHHRPKATFTVYAPPGVGLELPSVSLHPLPRLKLIGRHLLWPLRLRRSGADLYLGCVGQLPLGGVGMPAVVTAHDLAIYRHPEWFPPGQWLSTRAIVPRSFRQADMVLAVSHHTASDLTELMGLSPERIRVAPLGVDPALQPLQPAEREVARRQLQLPERFILFVSTLEPRKNLITLIDAWERLRDRPELVVVGGWGWRCEEIRTRLDKVRGGIRLLGAVPPQELPALYSLATCLAHPAWYEGFGLPPLEAMACGTPVVASNSSSLPEVVGEAGLLVDPADVEGWTAALAQMLGDEQLRQELQIRGFQRTTELSWEQTAQATWEVIDEILTYPTGVLDSP